LARRVISRMTDSWKIARREAVAGMGGRGFLDRIDKIYRIIRRKRE